MYPKGLPIQGPYSQAGVKFKGFFWAFNDYADYINSNSGTLQLTPGNFPFNVHIGKPVSNSRTSFELSFQGLHRQGYVKFDIT